MLARHLTNREPRVDVQGLPVRTRGWSREYDDRRGVLKWRLRATSNGVVHQFALALPQTILDRAGIHFIANELRAARYALRQHVAKAGRG